MSPMLITMARDAARQLLAPGADAAGADFLRMASLDLVRRAESGDRAGVRRVAVFAHSLLDEVHMPDGKEHPARCEIARLLVALGEDPA